MNALSTLIVQARLSWKNPAENLEHLEELLADSPGPFDLAVFPETFTTGFLGDSDLPHEDMNGPTVAWMREMASRYDSGISGSVVIVEDGKRFNRFLLATPDGKIQQYDKRHLFGFGGENERYVAGTERVLMQMGDWRICPQICYDLRFPVWCRNRDDYDLLLLVANWPGKRISHWVSLAQARAIENQSWVIAVNRVGEDGHGMVYPGRSLVISPGGEVVADLPGAEECRLLTLDLDLVENTRKTFPFQADADEFDFI